MRATVLVLSAIGTPTVTRVVRAAVTRTATTTRVVMTHWRARAMVMTCMAIR